jgi:hypothetical protein
LGLGFWLELLRADGALWWIWIGLFVAVGLAAAALNWANRA